MDERKFEMEILTRLTRIETKIENVNKIEDRANDALNISRNNRDRIEDLENANRWLTRTTMGAVIALVIQAVVQLLN